MLFKLEVETGFEPVVIQLCRLLLWAAQPLHQISRGLFPLRADDEIRTRDPNLGKVVLYQLSHIRMSFSRLENSNRNSQSGQTDTQKNGGRKFHPPFFSFSAAISAKCVCFFTVHNSVDAGNLILGTNSEAHCFFNCKTNDE
ncbi:MAG: hypothetical protein RI933_115 [Actinomycetota bacterium]